MVEALLSGEEIEDVNSTAEGLEYRRCGAEFEEGIHVCVGVGKFGRMWEWAGRRHGEGPGAWLRLGSNKFLFGAAFDVSIALPM